MLFSIACTKKLFRIGFINFKRDIKVLKRCALLSTLGVVVSRWVGQGATLQQDHSTGPQGQGSIPDHLGNGHHQGSPVRGSYRKLAGDFMRLFMFVNV